MIVPCGLTDLLFSLLHLMGQLDPEVLEHAQVRRVLLRMFDDLLQLEQQPHDNALDVELVPVSPAPGLVQ